FSFQHSCSSEMKFICLTLLIISGITYSRSEQYKVMGPADAVFAVAGEDVILPCSLKPNISVVDMRVEWFRPDLKEAQLVHLYEDHKDRNTEQPESFRGRTGLNHQELQRGNASLKLSSVQVSDEGRYKCFIQSKSWSDDANVNVLVEAIGTPPVITVDGFDDSGGLHLQCESEGWNPEPDLEWLNSKGVSLSSETTETHRNTDGFRVKHTTTVYERDSMIHCRVKLKHHMLETMIISSNKRFNPLRISVILISAIVVLIVIAGMLIVAFVHKNRELYHLNDENRTKKQEKDQLQNVKSKIQGEHDQLQKVNSKIQEECRHLQNEISRIQKEHEQLEEEESKIKQGQDQAQNEMGGIQVDLPQSERKMKQDDQLQNEMSRIQECDQLLLNDCTRIKQEDGQHLQNENMEREQEQYDVVGPVDPVFAVVGEDVILPCSVKPNISVVDMRVEWFRPDLKDSQLVHLYKDHEDRNTDQMQSYRGRTKLNHQELQRGNASLKLSSVHISDEGLYRCFIQSKSWYDDATVDVRTEVVGRPPVITVDGFDNSERLHLQCESEGWDPEPVLEWLNSEGVSLSSETAEVQRNTAGFSVKHTITVHHRADKIYCRVKLRHHMLETMIVTSSKSFNPWRTSVILSSIAVALIVIAGVLIAAFNHKYREHDKLQNENGIIKQEISEIQQEHDQLQEEKDRIQQQHVQLQTEISRIRQEYSELLQNENKRIAQERNQLQEEKQRIKHEHDQLQEKMQKIQQDSMDTKDEMTQKIPWKQKMRNFMRSKNKKQNKNENKKIKEQYLSTNREKSEQVKE
ncbi:hypothetical protein QQF64_025449, partial [Cirrhinus molitorella]